MHIWTDPSETFQPIATMYYHTSTKLAGDAAEVPAGGGLVREDGQTSLISRSMSCVHCLAVRRRKPRSYSPSSSIITCLKEGFKDEWWRNIAFRNADRKLTARCRPVCPQLPDRQS